MIKNLKMYQLCVFSEMLLDRLKDVLVLSLLVFALLGKLSMNYCQY